MLHLPFSGDDVKRIPPSLLPTSKNKDDSSSRYSTVPRSPESLSVAFTVTIGTEFNSRSWRMLFSYNSEKSWSLKKKKVKWRVLHGRNVRIVSLYSVITRFIDTS